MSGGSLGIRSASYGSLEKQLQNGLSPIQTGRKQVKMVKEKERLFHWICKFAGRKKVGMLFLCVISAAVFVWVLYVGKGEDSQEGNGVQNISVNESMSINDSPSIVSAAKAIAKNLLLPPSYFLGYNLPPGHPCNSFTLPPPPADKKRTGPRPCPVCYLPVDEAIGLMPEYPSPSPVLKNLTFIYEENLSRDGEFGGSDFGGYPTLAQRNDSFDIRESMCVHCGFVRGIKPGRNTGFDMDEDDLLDMEQCRGIVVASAVFGNFDEINEPKNVSEHSKNTVCFLMFVDEETEKYLTSSGRLGTSKKIGLWRIIVARNLPYTDARRTGKIPKLLLHRMAPNARYSIWLDGKLELVVDPYQILERFLWRTNATFAISKHYRRFDVFVEAEANKAAAKYDNASIDFQIDFYKNEGLTPYSEAKLPLISDVPEGCVIIREHIPISNLFTCLWFGEVDRFTSRDQISFSTVRDKFLSRVDFHFHMFLDCERRNFVVQKYHRGVLGRLSAPVVVALNPPPPLLSPPPPLHMLENTQEKVIPITRRGPGRRGKDKRPGSRRHRKVAAGNRDIEAN
ncbi:probable hexosyltransferase MUCI70 [Vicia villosa]|uniref:probable hexosyltransferase MUCI70 n=1 Tax=Vicia villosa TaxID=3911 RepID=UPI00273BEDBF|nr:probable hexosyltransferase MUCI70 [Vicia villosa]XP_058771570.1 probable hexosyltransferase MUCI70 [Vicia villosa]